MDAIKNVKGIVISKSRDTDELKSLAESLGYEIKKIFIQERKRETPYYIGKGKIDEIKSYVDSNNIEIAFINDSLKPSQWYNLEKILGVDVYDRIRLILEVFADRANRKEAKLQVKLAKLRYEKPFVRELIHRTKEKEKVGFSAGGEYPVADYYEMIKKQMKRIKRALIKIEKERELKRRERRQRGFYLVSIAGYTNAGKSSLLNILTGEKVVIEERLFSTLSTTTSRIKKFKKSVPILLTDTVGFIKDLPHWLIDSFHSTLEEIELADVVIILIDSSDEFDEMKSKALTSIREIEKMKNHPKIIVALNKIDLVEKNDLKNKKKFVEEELEKECIEISIKERINIDKLVEKIYDALSGEINGKIILSAYDKNVISWIYKNTEVNEFEMDGRVRIEIRCNKKMRDVIIGKCTKIGGKVIFNEYGRKD